jgi:hypothetical protein
VPLKPAIPEVRISVSELPEMAEPGRLNATTI